MAKRIVYIIMSLGLILTLSFSSFALIEQSNGVCYSNLPEPSPSNSSCALVVAVPNSSGGGYQFYMFVFSLYKNVDSVVGSDHTSGSNSYRLYEHGNINVVCKIDTDKPSITFGLFDGSSVIQIVNGVTDFGAGGGVYGVLQIWNLANNNLLSDASIKDILTKEWTYNWNINSFKAYGNIIVDTYGSKRYSQANKLSIAWNEAYTSKLELDQLVTISNTLSSIKSSSSSIDSRLDDLNKMIGIEDINSGNSIFNVLQSGFLTQALYLESLKRALAESNDHQSNIDNAINGSGKSYSDFDKSTINEYDDLEKSLNSDFSGDFSNIVNNLDVSSFGNSFTFWRDSFNALIVSPVDNIGYILTSFITFALVLGLVVFILGKRG